MNEERKPNSLKPQYPPPEFWRALLAYRTHVIAQGFDPYFSEPFERHECSARNAADVVDNYLEVAIDAGWLED